MTEAKDEAGGRAGTVEFDTYSRSTDGRVWISPQLIAKALLINPEARMAVLVECPEFQQQSRELSEARVALAGAEARVVHLEEAAELLRRAEGYERRGDLETQDWHQLMRVDIPAWYDRDQALSAPTAESGKDSACYCNQYQSSDIPCPPGKCPNAPPAPVAEAPERVTHERASRALQSMPAFDIKPMLLRYIGQQSRLQEQSEREVAATQRLFDDALRLVAEGDEREKTLRTQLTAANLKAEGLWVDNEELKAKLAESERKLERLQQRGWYLLTVFGYNKTDAYPDQQHGALGALRGALEAASTEPAGVEAVWTQEELDAVEREATELHEKLGNPTPTETEAPARFRVGQRVRRSGNITKGEGIVTRLVSNDSDFNNWVKWDNGGECSYQDRELEPADPAPPKPDGYPAHWSDCSDCNRDGGYCAKHPAPRPGRDKPVMLSQLLRALRRWDCEGPEGAIDELEKGGKS